MRDAKTWVTYPKLGRVIKWPKPTQPDLLRSIFKRTAGNAGLNEGGEGVPRLEKVRRTGYSFLQKHWPRR